VTFITQETLRESAIQRMKENRRRRKHFRKLRARTSDPARRLALRESFHGRLLREDFVGKDC
jgi:hypothetical protein